MARESFCQATASNFQVEKSGSMNPGGFTAVFTGCNNEDCPMKSFVGTHMEYPAVVNGEKIRDDSIGILYEARAKNAALQSVQIMCRLP